jgi:hypothetical protein
MKNSIYFFFVSFLSYVPLFAMDGVPQMPSLNIRPIARTQSCELKKDELVQDAGMIKAVTKAAGKGASPRALQASAGSPRYEGRPRASSLAKDSTAEYLGGIIGTSK